MIMCADAAHIPLADNSVHCVVTSPPYWGLRTYGHWKMQTLWGDPRDLTPSRRKKDRWWTRLRWRAAERGGVLGPQSGSCLEAVRAAAPWVGALGMEPDVELYVRHLVEVFREVRRVLRPDGTLWLNMGDTFAGSWGNYGARDGEQRAVTEQRWLRPAYEDRLNGWHGLPPTAHVPGLKPKDLIGVPWRVALALQADGWWLRSDIIWHKPNAMPESVADRPTRAHEHLFLLAKDGRYFYDAEAVKEAVNGTAHGRGEGVNPKARMDGENSRMFQDRDHNHPAGRKRRPDRCRQNESFSAAVAHLVSARNRRDVWTIATQPYAGAHFATFPPELVEPCVLAGTSARGCCPACGAPWTRIITRRRTLDGEQADLPPMRNHDQGAPDSAQGFGHWRVMTSTETLGWAPGCEHGQEPVPCVVLDPFCGSGTTGAVCKRLGRRHVMMDLNGGYLSDQAAPRLALTQAGFMI